MSHEEKDVKKWMLYWANTARENSLVYADWLERGVKEIETHQTAIDTMLKIDREKSDLIAGQADELEAKDKENQSLKLALSEACDDIDTLYSMTEWIENDYMEGRSKIYRELLTKGKE